MKIKAISLWQPWAGLVAAGLKKFETRSRLTHHRGPLLICSAKKFTREQGRFEISVMRGGALLQPWMRKTGVALCIVDVVGCWKILRNETMADVENATNVRGLPNDELNYGDYGFGRYAWELKNLRPLGEEGEESFYVHGRQFMFDVEVPEALLKTN